MSLNLSNSNSGNGIPRWTDVWFDSDAAYITFMTLFSLMGGYIGTEGSRKI